MNSQPKALYILNFVSMWECFSFYGMRLLLVLFMIDEFNYSDHQALGVYALYITLVDLSALIGGIVADRYLGLKRSIILGGITIFMGHLCMMIPDSQTIFFMSLGFIVAGTGLFRSNVAAFLGKFYAENDPRLDSAYTLYYTGINIGGFLASIVCAIAAEIYGWHIAFGLASLGMFTGIIGLYLGQKYLKIEEEVNLSNANVKGALGLIMAILLSGGIIYYNESIMPFFPVIVGVVLYYIYKKCKEQNLFDSSEFNYFVGYIAFLILFYSCEEQLGSSLILFSERHVDRETIFGTIPAASLITFNPLTVILVGPLLTKVFTKIQMSSFFKIGLGFVLLATAFLILSLSDLMANMHEKIPLVFVITSFICISLGELFVGPTVYAAASKLSKKGMAGFMMGLTTLGYALANLLSGFVSQFMTGDQYFKSFGLIAIVAGIIAALIISNRPKALEA